MNIPDPIIYTAVASVVGLQTWMVRELFALKQGLAELQPEHKRTKRRSLIGLLLITASPWVAFLLLSACSLPNK